MPIIYHYTDRDTASDIRKAKRIVPFPVRVRENLIGGQEVILDKTIWFTRSLEPSQTVTTKLRGVGWPLEKSGMLWRFAIESGEGAEPDLVDWAFERRYEPQLFKWMMMTAQLVGENWEDWILVSREVPESEWVSMEYLENGNWVQSKGA